MSTWIFSKTALALCVFCIVGTLRSRAKTMPCSSLPAASAAAHQTDPTSPTNTLCNADRSLCVPRAAQNMLIANPFDIAVTAADSVSDVNWELDDQTGQKLASGKASNDPNWSGGGNPASPEGFHLRAYVFVLPKAATGVLKLSPVRNDRQGLSSKLPEADIPVRFRPGTSTLPVTVPKDYGQFQSEAGDWAGTSGPPSHFTPKSPFVSERLTVMRVNDVVFGSAEAAAEKASVLSQAPVRILNFAVQNGTAYVDLNLNKLQDHWAGISITIAQVEILIEKDLSQFPNIHNVAFVWPPGTTDSSASLRDPEAKQVFTIFKEDKCEKQF